MRKIRVHSILVLVIAALLVLSVIQIVQTVRLYDQERTEFNERFKTTLERIALHHEKAEDIRSYMLLADNDFSGQYRDILKEEFQNLLAAEESISIQDTTILENGEPANYLIIKGQAYDSVSGLSTEQRVLARDVRHLKDLFQQNGTHLSSDSMQVTIQLDQRVIQQIFKKARFVNQMMVDAFRDNVYEEPNERLDIIFLDSVLKHEIGLEKLPRTFEFMVTDQYGSPVEFDQSPGRYKSDLDTTQTHATLLFPSNPLDDDLYLHIFFPKEDSFVLFNMWGSLAMSILLLLVMIIAMLTMFRTILVQNRLSEMKNDFISNMTHEFRTPISTISLACEAINDPDMMSDPDSAKPFVKMIYDENRRLSVLVERILQSATLERGDLHLQNEDILLNEVIHEVVQNAKFRIAGTEGHIDLQIPIELIHIRGDRMHVTNAISNLIDNAIKYSGDKPDIRVSLTKQDHSLELSIADSGIGIKKEHLNKIFEKLYRVPTGNIHNVKGFGLGLSYVKAIVELHGWEIQVKSKPDHGSEFKIIMKH